MSSRSPQSTYDPALAERLVGLIEAGQDSAALHQLSAAPSSLRAEAAREFLWRGDDQGYQSAKTLVRQGTLAPEELRSIFSAAAECGETRMLKLIASTSPEAIEAGTIRNALLGALYNSQTASISWIADTELLSVESKYRAIVPPLFKSSEEHRGSLQARNELGTAEIIITKQYRDAQYELRQQRRQALRTQEEPSAAEKRQLRIERKFSTLLSRAINQIRSHRQRHTAELQGDELRNHREITALLIEQVTREVQRQREVALIERPEATRNQKPHRPFEVTTWRATNPDGHENSPSFAEMLENFFHANFGPRGGEVRTFDSFIDTVLSTWGANNRPLSRESLCRLIEKKHPQNARLTNSVFYQWRNYQNQTPSTESIMTLVAAFNLNKIHELLLFRIAKGTPCHDVETLVSRAEDALRTPEEARTRGELFTAITEASGIPLVNLTSVLGVHQIHMWKRGQRIEDPAVVSTLVDLIHPVDIYPKEEFESAQALSARIKAILGGRSASVLDAVFLAERSTVANPGGLLFSLLVGGRGIMPLSENAAASLLGVTEGKVRRMARPSPCRGGEITESIASATLDYVQGVTPSTRNLLSPIQKAERDLALDILTGVPSPIRLLMKASRGELSHAGEIHRLTRQRRGVLQEWGLSDFELGKATITASRASAMAKWLGFVGPQHQESRRLFITMATGTHSQETPSQILDDIISGKVERHIGVQKFFDWTGLTRAELARRIGASRTSGASYTSAQRAGRIFNQTHLSLLAEELGLRHRFDELVSVFTPKKYTP